MSSPAIQFKGSGWYITDYAKKDSTSATKAGGAKEGSTSSEGSSTTAPASSESKPPADKPATKSDTSGS
jgi:predicted nucleic acid-binding Zn ribbon protein